MNIYEMSQRTNISVSKLKKLQRLDVLKVDPENPVAALLRFHLARNQQLTAAHTLALLAAPEILDQLGKYTDRAKAQLAAIGSVTAAPRNVTAAIFEAGRGDAGEAETLAAWLRDVLPREAVPYHWVAVRLLYGLPDTLKKQYAKRLNIALANVRKLESFAGYWTPEEIGVRNKIIYHQPKLALDL